MEKRTESDLTRLEKQNALSALCHENAHDESCPLYGYCKEVEAPFSMLSDAAIDRLYEDYILKPQRDEVMKKAMKNLAGTDNPREAAKQILFGTSSSSYPSQKAKADYGKEELTLVPRRIIHDICAIRMYGNQKYPEGGPDNWKQVEIERYRNATFRHFLAYLDDPQGKDKESGFPHLWHLACNIAFLCEMEDKT
jgi:hypothetical protein